MAQTFPFTRKVQFFLWLFLLVVVLSWISCQPSNDSPIEADQYPILFKYQNLDFQPSKSYVLTATAFQALAPGTYSVEPYVAAELSIDDWGFEIEKVELLDSNHMHLYFFPALAIIPADTIVPYEKVGTDGIQIDANGVPPYCFRWDKIHHRLQFDLETIEYAKVNTTSGATMYSSFQLGEGISDNNNPGALIEEQRAMWHLQLGDTVLLNHSAWLFPEQ